MIAYIDTSVVLRLMFREPKPLKESPRVKKAFASRLLAVELGRAIDRARLAGTINDDEVATLRGEADAAVASIALVGLTDSILERASDPMPTSLKTLDALHLATAVELRAETEGELLFATHDSRLANAAKAMRFKVIGV